jgi:hypothetical protein
MTEEEGQVPSEPADNEDIDRLLKEWERKAESVEKSADAKETNDYERVAKLEEEAGDLMGRAGNLVELEEKHTEALALYDGHVKFRGVNLPRAEHQAIAS